MIDLRSDTVTLPSKEMKEAIINAELGDDVFSEDPTINDLEYMAAELMGMDSALLVPSGTMANLVAVLTHCKRGDEVILGDKAHTFLYEAGGISAFGGIQALDIAKDGNVKVIPVDITKSSMNNFLSNIHVYCLNIRRSASDILKEQSQMKPKVEGLMSRIKEMGYETLEILESGNFDRYGRLLDEYWALKKQLSNKVSVLNCLTDPT